MITRSGQTTSTAVMPPLAECLFNQRTTNTRLASTGRIHLNYYPRSIFRFRAQLIDKAFPSCIVNLFGEYRSRQSLDIEILYSNKIESVDNRPAQLMVEVGALLINVPMNTPNRLDCLAPTVRSSLSSSAPTLRYPQFSLGRFIVARVVDCATVRERGKRGYTNIDPDGLVTRRERAGFIFEHEDRKPSARFAFDRKSFNSAFKRAVEFDSQLADLGQPDSISTQRLSDLPERQTVIAARRTKTWIAWILRRFNPPEESAEGKVHALQGVFQDRDIDRRNVRPQCLNLNKLASLIKVRNRFSFPLPSLFPFLQGGVVELRAHGKLIIQRLLLSFGWINPVSKRLEHGSNCIEFKPTVGKNSCERR
jgi:hypothetical protein